MVFNEVEKGKTETAFRNFETPFQTSEVGLLSAEAPPLFSEMLKANVKIRVALTVWVNFFPLVNQMGWFLLSVKNAADCVMFVCSKSKKKQEKVAAKQIVLYLCHENIHKNLTIKIYRYEKNYFNDSADAHL
ncbi:MAG: hypothetical protein J6H19_06460 [Bacteroidaceae bacterium]|nr:hypothetical protein [Bacteroidaceae bacterium]